MTYLLYFIITIIAYILFYIIKYIISSLFPNFYKKHENKFKTNRTINQEVSEDNPDKNFGGRTLIELIIFFIMIFMINKYYNESIKLKNDIMRINKFKNNVAKSINENIILRKENEELKATSYFKDYLELKTKYEKALKQNEKMKIFIKENTKQTNFY